VSALADLPIDGFVLDALALRRRGDLSGTVALLDRKLPDRPDARGLFLLGETLLTLGDYARGWPLLEFRWLHPDLIGKRAFYDRPVWTGQDLAGRTVLVQVEQGIGDVVMFARYLPWLKALGARVLLLPRVDMATLARRLPGVDAVLADGAPVPPFDYVVHLMSLPARFGSTLDTVPSTVPYLTPDPALASEWRARVGDDAAPRVGLVWAGRATQSHNALRSIPLASLRPLLSTPGVRFFSLQKGEAEAELATLPAGAAIEPLGARFGALDDLVAAIDAMDLVVSVCTGPAHIAGAMGKPVWTLVAEPPDLRWLTSREDSPWYPTMRLFRQRTPGRWDDVIARVARELARGPDAWRALATRTGRAVDPPSAVVPVPSRDVLPHLAETRQGLLMFDPAEPDVGPSLERYGEWQRGALELALRLARRGGVVVEAGAGVGAHAVALGRLLGANGRLVLAEARAATRRMLEQNLAANGIACATLLPAEQGATVDALGLERVDGVKANLPVDAQSLVAGMADTLWRCRPWLLFGVADDAAFGRVAASLRDFGYRIWRMDVPLDPPDNFNRRAADRFGGRRALVLVSLPEELDLREPLPGCVEST
jgi:hypothetical protein